MSISATEGVTPGLLGQALPGSPTGAPESDKQMFLNLLVAQLRYQDPMNPTDSAEFLAQSAQFTALEKMEAVADQTAQMVAAQVAFGASSLVGRTVSYPLEDGSTATGTVSGVRFDATGPVLDVDGTDVPLANVQSVTAGSTGTTGTGTTPSTTSAGEPAAPGTV